MTTNNRPARRTLRQDTLFGVSSGIWLAIISGIICLGIYFGIDSSVMPQTVINFFAGIFAVLAVISFCVSIVAAGMHPGGGPFGE